MIAVHLPCVSLHFDKALMFAKTMFMQAVIVVILFKMLFVEKCIYFAARSPSRSQLSR